MLMKGVNLSKVPVFTLKEGLWFDNPKAWIFLWVVAINAVVCSVALVWLNYSLGRYHDEAKDRATNLGRVLETTVTTSLRSIDRTLLSMSMEFTNCYAQEGKNLSNCSKQGEILENMGRGHEEIRAFFYVDHRGESIERYSPHAVLSKAPLDVADRDYFQAFRTDSSQRLFISRPQIGRTSFRWVIHLARPVLSKQGEWHGIVVAALDLEFLHGVLQKVDLGPHGAVSLRDSEMGVILRFPEPKGIGANIGSKNISNQLSEMLAAQPAAGAYRAITPLDGVERTVTYTRSSNYPFYLNVGLSADDYLEPWKIERLITILVLVIVAIITTACGALLWRLNQRQTREIERREQSERALSVSETSFRLLVDNAPVGITLVNEDHSVAYHNPAFTRLLGYTINEIPSSNIWWMRAFPDEDYRQASYQAWRDAMREQQSDVPAIMTYRIHDASSNQRDVRFSVVRLPDRRVIVLSEDVTEESRNQKALKILNAELESRVCQRTADLERTFAQLMRSERLAALGGLVAGVAHELNTPIGNALVAASSLASHGQLLQSSLTQGLTRSALNEFLNHYGEFSVLLESNLQRARSLIGSFKKLAVDKASYHSCEFALQAVIEDIMPLFSSHLHSSQHVIDYRIPNSLRMNSYRGPLGEVIINLIGNALTHAFHDGQAGKIVVEASELVIPDRGDSHPEMGGGLFVEIVVSDNGCGIPPENRHRIFDPFFTTRLGRGGSGLGLNIVYNLVTDLLGGSIAFRDREGGGCQFVLTLPLAAPVAWVEK